jgi:small subunit ribosomal protein S6
MNRKYELMFIVRPDMVEEDQNKLISTLESSVTSAGGTAKSEVWGKRRLAYKVGKFNDGIFVLMLIEATGAAVHEVERRLRVTEPVIKFLTVRTDEELKRIDKIKKLRDAKKKVSAQPAAAQAPVTSPVPASVTAATPATPEPVTETPATTPV